MGQSAAGIDIGSDLQVAFIRYLDELTPSHVKVLTTMLANESILDRIRSWPVLYDVIRIEASLIMTPEEFQLFCNDLRARLLIRASDRLHDFEDISHGPVLRAVEEGDDRAMIRVTDIGRKFLRFVSQPQVELASASTRR